MYLIKNELIVLIKIIVSCLTSLLLVIFISSLSGEDLKKNHETIQKLADLSAEMNTELDGGIDQRIKQLGEVPSVNPYRKFYCVEFAKEIHDISRLTERQKILFATYNVRDFEGQLKRMMEFTETADSKKMADELEIVKRELKNSVNLIEEKRKSLIRQRTAYIILFFVLWIITYLYYSRGIVFKKKYDE